MNTMKKNGGFTLVELIIVIAILAILSTGAIAGYSAYIKSANNAAVEAVLSDISTSAVLANAKAGGIKTITVTKTASAETLTIKVEFDTTDSAKDFSELFTGSLNATPVQGQNNTYTISVPSSWANSDYAKDTDGVKWENNKWEDPSTT